MCIYQFTLFLKILTRLRALDNSPAQCSRNNLLDLVAVLYQGMKRGQVCSKSSLFRNSEHTATMFPFDGQPSLRSATIAYSINGSARSRDQIA